MRVSHVITRLTVGGAQENTVASVLGLQAQAGMQVDLITGPSTGSEGSLEHAFLGCPERLTLVPQLVRPIHLFADWLALGALTKIFRRTRPDLVHTHSGKAGVLGRLAAHRAGVPVIVHTIHGPSFGAFQGSLSNAILRAAERRAGAVTTHFVSVANAMTRQYLAAGIGRMDQYTTIRSGFDLAPFAAARNDPGVRARWGIAPEDIVITKLARLVPLKGHTDLWTVAPLIVAKNPRIRFLLIGDGKLGTEFQYEARRRGLARHFIFTGLIPPDEVPSLLGITDLLVHLSSREGLARALPQALAAGRPVVAYDCDGAAEVCLENKTGFLLRAGDLAALSARLLQLAGDPALRARLGGYGQSLVSRQFALPDMVDALRRLYLQLGHRTA